MKSSRKKKDNKVLILILIMVISGIFGFIYETIFYRIDLGYFVKRGNTIGPWLPINATGGQLIYLINKNDKDNILKVFILSALVCGTLEYTVGYLLYNISNIRLWDYNTEILNYGNIEGFVCLRSVLFFGLSGVFLMNMVLPKIKEWIRENKSQKTKYITIFIGGLFIVDFIMNYIIK